MSSYDFSDTHQLTDSAESLLRSVLKECDEPDGSPPKTYWWIKTLLEKRGPMAADAVPGLTTEVIIKKMTKKLSEEENSPTLPTAILIKEAAALAAERGKSKAYDRDIIVAILDYLKLGSNTRSSTPSASLKADESSSSTGTEYVPRNTDPTPTLDERGVDFTQLANQGKLGKVLGRENEIQQIIETLCRQKKRNPALVGPAGVGKTAIIEGLAQMIAAGDVPDPLKGCRLISLESASLVADSGVVGKLEKRITTILKEASQEGIILFIDEVHTIMGAGGTQGTGDVASLLKPALARGDIACIVATTDVEYRRYITADSALERRFNPVLINEISREHTLLILQSFRDSLQEKRGVNVEDDTLDALIHMAGRFMRNRRFPDKALDLLDHCIASAVTQNKDLVTLEDAREIVQKKVGMPVDTEAGLNALKGRLLKTNILSQDHAKSIVHRLQTTTEDLDLAPKRPNAVVLLHGTATTVAEDLASSIASSVFGSANRMVRIDLSGLTQDNHINALLGSPAGYIGHGDPLPHDPVQQTPWCVVWWENIHLCHPAIRALLTRVMETGKLKDNRGQTTFFSDTIIIATAGDQAGSKGSPASIGFSTSESLAKTATNTKDLEKALGKGFLDQCGMIIDRASSNASSGALWINENILTVAAERYAERGLEINWDQTFIDWMKTHPEKPGNIKEWEGLLDQNVNPALREILRKNKAHRTSKVIVRTHEGNVIIESEEEN